LYPSINLGRGQKIDVITTFENVAVLPTSTAIRVGNVNKFISVTTVSSQVQPSLEVGHQASMAPPGPWSCHGRALGLVIMVCND
jgi:hypothetical protein